MDYSIILTSINKVAVVAFFGILVLILVEVFMMFKDKKKQKAVKIPDFDPKFGNAVRVATTKVESMDPVKTKSMVKMLVISTLLLILFGLMAVFGNYFLSQQKQNEVKEQVKTLEPKVELVEADGIIIFNKSWKKINLQSIPVTEGDTLYIGVATVKNSDVDKARIKINKKDWGLGDEVTAFNKEKGVYYMNYTIATDESSLKIDAQLHSQKDGWLSE